MSNDSIQDRKKMVLAMEMLARSVSDEELFDIWLRNGVADGDIKPFSLDVNEVDDFYVTDETFKQLTNCFMTLMILAKNEGGLDSP